MRYTIETYSQVENWIFEDWQVAGLIIKEESHLSLSEKIFCIKSHERDSQNH
ncbi:hypothetical protein LIHA111178_13220 [Litorimonas haliclonae]